MRKFGTLNNDTEIYAEIGWVVEIVGMTRYSYRFLVEKPI
jgi:hypothetical protein